MDCSGCECGDNILFIFIFYFQIKSILKTCPVYEGLCRSDGPKDSLFLFLCVFMFTFHNPILKWVMS